MKQKIIYEGELYIESENPPNGVSPQAFKVGYNSDQNTKLQDVVNQFPNATDLTAVAIGKEQRDIDEKAAQVNSTVGGAVNDASVTSTTNSTLESKKIINKNMKDIIHSKSGRKFVSESLLESISKKKCMINGKVFYESDEEATSEEGDSLSEAAKCKNKNCKNKGKGKGKSKEAPEYVIMEGVIYKKSDKKPALTESKKKKNPDFIKNKKTGKIYQKMSKTDKAGAVASGAIDEACAKTLTEMFSGVEKTAKEYLNDAKNALTTCCNVLCSIRDNAWNSQPEIRRMMDDMVVLLDERKFRISECIKQAEGMELLQRTLPYKR